MKAVFLVALIAVAFAAATTVEVDETELGYPPVVFTYNATACIGCTTACTAKFGGPVQRVARQACKKDCRKEEFCTRFVPAEMIVPPPAAPVNNCTASLLPVVPPVEYSTAENKPEDSRDFLKKLREYIKWKEAQIAAPQHNTAEFKPEPVIMAPPQVCLDCIKAAGQGEMAVAEFGDMSHPPVVPVVRRRRGGKKPAATPATPVTPAKPAAGPANPETAAPVSTAEAKAKTGTPAPGKKALRRIAQRARRAARKARKAAVKAAVVQRKVQAKAEKAAAVQAAVAAKQEAAKKQAAETAAPVKA